MNFKHIKLALLSLPLFTMAACSESNNTASIDDTIDLGPTTKKIIQRIITLVANLVPYMTKVHLPISSQLQL